MQVEENSLMSKGSVKCARSWVSKCWYNYLNNVPAKCDKIIVVKL